MLPQARWQAAPEEAALPAPGKPQDPATAVATVAAAAPARAALARRLGAAGAWPHGATLLPPVAVVPEQLPDDFMYGRIFISKRETLSLCMERNLFVSNRCGRGGAGLRREAAGQAEG